MAGLCGSGKANCAMLEDILDGLFHIAKADGMLHEREGRFLHRIAEIFRIEENHYRSILARHADLGAADPYLILGIERGSPLGEVKKQYRKLVAANHPDRLIARGVPEEFIKIATTQDRRDQRRLRDDRAGAQARMSGFAPDHSGAEVRVSPNFGQRRGLARPDMIILHYTGMATGAAAEAWLCDPASEVSSHYLVHEDGRIVQMVRESDRAWHAGKGSWRGETDINSRSVGIEIVNPGHALGYTTFPKRQIAAVIELCRGITARHAILPQRVLAHSDVAPGRKIDPGEKFPWLQARRGGRRSFCRAGAVGRPAGAWARRQRRGGRGAAVDAFALRLRHRHHRRVR